MRDHSILNEQNEKILLGKFRRILYFPEFGRFYKEDGRLKSYLQLTFFKCQFKFLIKFYTFTFLKNFP